MNKGNMRILLFGASGFLGKSLLPLLEADGHNCFTVSRKNTNSSYTIDISNFKEFEILNTEYFDAVINCATILPGGDYLDNNYLNQIYKTNILGTQNICKWINEQDSIKKIINCSTLAVVSKPWNINLSEDENTYPVGHHVLYCSSKLTQELLFSTLASKKNISLTHFRFSALYGKHMHWSGLICNFIDQARAVNKINLTNGSKVSADFLYVEDASKIILAALRSEISGIVNAASGIETTIMELAEVIKFNLNGKVVIENVEKESFIEDRSVIDVSKLNTIIDTKKFVDLKTGISQILSQ